MKNFPHQFNKLDKLTAALGVAQTLIGAAAPYNDATGGTFGDALVQAGVYGFRDKTLSPAAALALEAQKPIRSQGSRTAGRDIRHFFELAGLVEQGPALTALGSDILAAGNNQVLRNALWREAMLRTVLHESGAPSHPYRILLRLVADRPGIEKRKLMLAFEAVNDGDAEYQRMLNLADSQFDQILVATGATGSSAKNAVKILPSIAEQVGDIRTVNGRSYAVVHAGFSEDSLLEPETPADYESSAPGAATAFTPNNIAPIPNFAAAGPVNIDLAAAIALRNRRIVEHHNAVASIAAVFAAEGYTTFARPYDCLGYRAAAGGVLVEVKTLDGTRSDERRQAEKALGQLKGYKHYSVAAANKAPNFAEVVAYSAPPSETIGFMAANEIHSAWRQGYQWVIADLQGNISNFSPDALLA